MLEPAAGMRSQSPCSCLGLLEWHCASPPSLHHQGPSDSWSPDPQGGLYGQMISPPCLYPCLRVYQGLLSTGWALLFLSTFFKMPRNIPNSETSRVLEVICWLAFEVDFPIKTMVWTLLGFPYWPSNPSPFSHEAPLLSYWYYCDTMSTPCNYCLNIVLVEN